MADSILTQLGTKVGSEFKAHRLRIEDLENAVGVADGIATLDENGKVPTTQLPSYVDDVVEYADLASFPATGETSKIYVDLDTNKVYRWSGSAYVYITSGAVDSVAGKTGVVTLAKADVGLDNVDNTADSAKNVFSATKLTAARNITLDGDVTGSVSFDGSGDVTITAAVEDDSHNHVISNVDGLQDEIDRIDWQANLMTEAEFQALAAKRREQYAASGVVELGDANTGGFFVNTSIWGFSTDTRYINGVMIGREKAEKYSVNGVLSRLGNSFRPDGSNIGRPATNGIMLPSAPTVTHADSTKSGLVKNGDFSLGDNGDWNNGTLTPTYNGDGTVTLARGATFNGGFTQSIPTEQGKKYVIEIHHISGNIAATWPTPIGSLATSEKRLRLEFTATGSVFQFSIWPTYANTSITVGNISVIESASLSRQDLVFLESWDEDISEKGNFVYPYGNVQYRGADVDGLTGIADGSFTGKDTYSLFGNWQAANALVGKGYDWDLLSDAQKAAFAGNPENNLRKDGDKIIQTRYKIRVEQGVDDSPVITDYGFAAHATEKGLYYNSSTGKYAIEIAAVQRNNSGVMHPVFNHFGTAKTTDSKFWYDTATTIASTIDCFNPSRVGGLIGTSSGRPDGKFYNAIYADDIIDLRNSAHEKPKAEILEDIKRSLISGEKRSDFDGDGVWETRLLYSGTSYRKDYYGSPARTFLIFDTLPFPYLGYEFLENSDGESLKREFIVKFTDTGLVFNVYKLGFSTSNSLYILGGEPNVDLRSQMTGNVEIHVARKSTHKQSGTKLHCDIIGDPANYPQVWKDALTNGYTLMGTPLLVGENGEDYIPDGTDKFRKFSNKVVTGLQTIYGEVPYSTWTVGGVETAVSTITNGWTGTAKEFGVLLFFYTTTDNPTYPVFNSECLEIGDVWAGNAYQIGRGCKLNHNLINKVSTGDSPNTSGIYTRWGKFVSLTGIPITLDPTNGAYLRLGITDEVPYHSESITDWSNESSPVAKTLFTLSQENGRYVCDVKFKEMKYDTDWGDDNKINIVHNVTTTTDDNGNKVLIGNKRIKTEYFVKEK